MPWYFKGGSSEARRKLNEIARAVSGQRAMMGSPQLDVLHSMDMSAIRNLDSGMSAFQRRLKDHAILLKNTTGAAIPAGHILMLGTPVVDPADDEAAFRADVHINGVFPSGRSLSNIAVMGEQTEDGQTGKAAVFGVVPARVDFQSTSHQFATPVVGQSVLQSAAEGNIEIVWSPGLLGEQWCLVWLARGGSVFTDQVIVVRVQNDGGVAGDLSSSCTFTYAIWDNYANYLVDDPLATGLAPAQIRLPNTKYVAANDNSRGLAFYDTEASLWRLLYCFRERPDVGDCSV